MLTRNADLKVRMKRSFSASNGKSVGVRDATPQARLNGSTGRRVCRLKNEVRRRGVRKKKPLGDGQNVVWQKRRARRGSSELKDKQHTVSTDGVKGNRVPRFSAKKNSTHGWLSSSVHPSQERTTLRWETTGLHDMFYFVCAKVAQICLEHFLF